MKENKKMTVEEHIGRLSGDYKCWDNTISHEEALEIDRVFEEIQQYRELGTVEEIIKVFNNQRTIIATQHETLKRYRAIGTVEEFKALKEKSVAKKLEEWADGSLHCPNCEKDNTSLGFKVCVGCGQKLNLE